MALMERVLPLPIHAPMPPDQWICHPHHGAMPIVPLDCQTAIEQSWPDGRSFVRYFLQDPRPSTGQWLPNYEYLGSCRVAIETAGPHEHLPHSILLRPHELRGMAGYLIQKCAVDNSGIGGFITLGLNGAMSYIHNPTNGTWSGNFLTISIQPRLHRDRNLSHLEPGNHNPNIAWILSAHAASLGRALGSTGRKWFFDSIAVDLYSRALQMQTTYDANLTWWSKDGVFSWWAARFDPLTRTGAGGGTMVGTGENWTATTGHLADQESAGEPRARGNGSSAFPSSRDGHDDNEGVEGGGGGAGTSDDKGDTPQGAIRDGEGGTNGDGSDEATSPIREDPPEPMDASDMTYQCDDSLGNAPNPTDCEKLSWSGLKPPHTVETLQPGVPKFFTQGTCALGISSIAPTTILWTHLIAAFEALNMICVQNPISRVKGGRAYFGKQAVSSWINGKARKRRRKRRGAAEDVVDGTDALPPGINATIFKHDAKSQLACEWTLAGEGKNLSSCRVD